MYRPSFIATRIGKLERFSFSDGQSFEVRYDGRFYCLSRPTDVCEFPHYTRKAAVAAMFSNQERNTF